MFAQIDGVWTGDLMALAEATDLRKYFPSVLYVNAHIKIRVAMELAFQSQMQEARRSSETPWSMLPMLITC